jgi:hypothetical protein
MIKRIGWRSFRAASLASLIAWSGLASAQAQSQTAHLTPQAVAAIVETYYQGAIKEHIPTLVQASIAHNQTDERAKRLALIAFMAGLIADDATFVERLAPVFHVLPGEQPMRLVRAILYSGRPDWMAQLNRLKGLWPARAAEIDKTASIGAKPVYELKFRGQPEVLDMSWAYFGASGRRESVMAIIDTLADLRSDDPALVAAAVVNRRSLADRATRDELVMEICRRALWGSNGNELRAVVIAAEAGNLSLLDDVEPVAVSQQLPAPTAATARSPRRGS